MNRDTLREAAAEFLGTFILIMFGVGVVAQVVLGEGRFGEALSINFGWGVAVTLGCYVAGGISGAHLNPAVTLALAIHRGFAWGKVLPYILAQFAGAFAASALVYLTYREAILHFDPELTLKTAGIWATYPQDYLSNVPGGLIDQIVGTALLMLVIFAISDARNMALPPSIGPIVVGATVFVIGMTYGLNSGYAINPARDLGPRFFTFVAGWGNQVFTAHDGWWWVPVVGPMIGAVVGGLVYDLFITRLYYQEATHKKK
jgi:MIP family channel proteins